MRREKEWAEERVFNVANTISQLQVTPINEVCEIFSDKKPVIRAYRDKSKTKQRLEIHREEGNAWILMNFSTRVAMEEKQMDVKSFQW